MEKRINTRSASADNYKWEKHALAVGLSSDTGLDLFLARSTICGTQKEKEKKSTM